ELGGVVGSIQKAVLILVVVRVAEANFVQQHGTEDMVIRNRDRLRAVILFVGLVRVAPAGYRGCAMIGIRDELIVALPVIDRIKTIFIGNHLVEAGINLVRV